MNPQVMSLKPSAPMTGAGSTAADAGEQAIHCRRFPLERRLVSAPPWVASPACWGGIGSVVLDAAEEAVRSALSLETVPSQTSTGQPLPMGLQTLRECFGGWNWSRLFYSAEE